MNSLEGLDSFEVQNDAVLAGGNLDLGLKPRCISRIIQLIAVLLCLNLAWFSASSAAFVTAAGKQCPTAAVQTIRVAVFNCCHQLVGFASRPVREGDKQFVQCRCAEKSQTQLKMTAAPRLDWWMPRDCASISADTSPRPFARLAAIQVAYKQFAPSPAIPPPLTA